MSDRELKQQYLRKEVLEKNYNVEEFIKFMNEKLAIGDDLDQCSLDELKTVVEAFIIKSEEELSHT